MLPCFFLSAVIFIIRAVIFSTTRSLTTCSLWGSCLICSANNQSIIIKRLLLMWKSFFACDPITELGNRAFFFQVANREHGKQMFFILSGCLSGYRRKMAPDRNGLEPWFKMACPARFELATSWFVELPGYFSVYIYTWSLVFTCIRLTPSNTLFAKALPTSTCCG